MNGLMIHKQEKRVGYALRAFYFSSDGLFYGLQFTLQHQNVFLDRV